MDNRKQSFLDKWQELTENSPKMIYYVRILEYPIYIALTDSLDNKDFEEADAIIKLYEEIINKSESLIHLITDTKNIIELFTENSRQQLFRIANVYLTNCFTMDIDHVDEETLMNDYNNIIIPLFLAISKENPDVETFAQIKSLWIKFNNKINDIFS